MTDMDRIDAILQNKDFQKYLKKNNEAEADRRFCRHNIGHFLDVARIARIINEEEQLNVPVEWFYGAALLHDIGRHVQYSDGTPHEQASAVIAQGILQACGFAEEETEIIAEAILSHRDGSIADEKSLRGLLYRADKASRSCFACEAEPECDWKKEKKNLRITY